MKPSFSWSLTSNIVYWTCQENKNKHRIFVGEKNQKSKRSSSREGCKTAIFDTLLRPYLPQRAAFLLSFWKPWGITIWALQFCTTWKSFWLSELAQLAPFLHRWTKTQRRCRHLHRVFNGGICETKRNEGKRLKKKMFVVRSWGGWWLMFLEDWGVIILDRKQLIFPYFIYVSDVSMSIVVLLAIMMDMIWVLPNPSTSGKWSFTLESLILNM